MVNQFESGVLSTEVLFDQQDGNSELYFGSLLLSFQVVVFNNFFKTGLLPYLVFLHSVVAYARLAF